MASGFFALLDDIGALMDDVAVLSKVTTKKTAGILGDDLAVNAEKASGFVSSREIPVLWAITKGSFINKLIILPIAFLLSAFFPAAVTVILVLGGIYLAFEGAEKIYEYVVPHKHAEGSTPDVAVVLTEEEVLELEKTKVKSAIITDFILSVEIVIIALGAVMGQTLLLQIIVVTIVAIIATVGVYGIVALIVRMDDFGLKLIEKSNGTGFAYRFGTLLVGALPYVIKSLSVIGTIALLLVSGGIFAHNLDFFHPILASWPALIREFLIGLVIGLLAVVVFKVVLWVVGMVRG